VQCPRSDGGTLLRRWTLIACVTRPNLITL